MKFLLIVIFTLFESTQLKAEQNKFFVCKEKNFVDTIKITYENDLIYIPITINNTIYKFMLDTGASIIILNEKQRNLMKEKNGKIRVGDTNNERRKELEQGILHEMTLGKIHISDAKCCFINDSILVRYDGILGVSTLITNGISFKIDTKKNIIILTDIKNYFENEQGYDIKYNSNKLLDINFSMSHGCSGTARFDTGANLFITINKKDYFDKSIKGKARELFKKQIIWKDYGANKFGIHGIEKTDEHIFMQINELKLNNLILKKIPAEITHGHTLIGCKILKYGSIIINPEMHKLKYQTYNFCDTIDINENPRDITYTYEKGKISISMLNPNSHLFKQGLRKGDCLIEYNGIKFRNICDFLYSKKDADNKAKFQNAKGEIIDIILH